MAAKRKHLLAAVFIQAHERGRIARKRAGKRQLRLVREGGGGGGGPSSADAIELEQELAFVQVAMSGSSLHAAALADWLELYGSGREPC